MGKKVNLVLSGLIIIFIFIYLSSPAMAVDSSYKFIEVYSISKEIKRNRNVAWDWKCNETLYFVIYAPDDSIIYEQHGINNSSGELSISKGGVYRFIWRSSINTSVDLNYKIKVNRFDNYFFNLAVLCCVFGAVNIYIFYVWTNTEKKMLFYKKMIKIQRDNGAHIKENGVDETSENANSASQPDDGNKKDDPNYMSILLTEENSKYAIDNIIRLMNSEKRLIWIKWGYFWIIQGALFILFSTTEVRSVSLVISFGGMVLAAYWYPIIQTGWVRDMTWNTLLVIYQKEIEIVVINQEHLDDRSIDHLSGIFVIIIGIWFWISIIMIT